MNSRFTAPIFEGGVMVGEMPLGQGAANPLPMYRDRAAEELDKQQSYDAAFQKADPEGYATRRQLLRCQQTTLHYGNLVSDLRFAISQKSAEMNSSNPDYVGLSAERREQLQALQAQLNEAEQEHAAALEEEQAAEAALAAVTNV
jgi:hypothetical protein